MVTILFNVQFRVSLKSPKTFRFLQFSSIDSNVKLRPYSQSEYLAKVFRVLILWPLAIFHQTDKQLTELINYFDVC